MVLATALTLTVTVRGGKTLTKIVTAT